MLNLIIVSGTKVFNDEKSKITFFICNCGIKNS
jgi:hypothetical protein